MRFGLGEKGKAMINRLLNDEQSFTCHHVLVVINTSKWNFLLVFRRRDNKAFLGQSKCLLMDSNYKAKARQLTTCMSTPLYDSLSDVNDFKK